MESKVDYSSRSFAWLAKSDQNTSFWRTSQRSLLEEWIPFSGSWPRSGMMRSGIASRLHPLVPRIFATESSLWPTPTVPDHHMVGRLDEWGGSWSRSTIQHLSKEDRTGPLNPVWVEWLMGFPDGWTDLKDSETQSYRRSQSS